MIPMLICEKIDYLNKGWGVPFEVENDLREHFESNYAERQRLASLVADLNKRLLAYQGEPNMKEMDAINARYRKALERIEAGEASNGCILAMRDAHRIAHEALNP